MSQRSELEAKLAQANNYIQQGYTPEQAYDMAGISAANEGAVEIRDDGLIYVSGGYVLFEDAIRPTPTVTEVEEIQVSGGTSTLTTGDTKAPNEKSEALQAEADALEAERKAAYEVAKANAKSEGLTGAKAVQAASQDPEVQAARAAEDAKQKEADAAQTTIPGVTTYYDVSGNEITLEEYNKLSPDNRTHTSATRTDGIASSDDPTVQAQENEEVELDDDGNPIPTDAELDAEFDAAEAEEARNNVVTQKQADDQNDWRVRLHLGPSADYLYKSTDPGILKPLQATNGIIFPYTPTIAIQHNADYENYDLVHSNYRGYFYRGSQVQNILITATFTANDVEEANYLLASLHFLKSCTKMFYGQDANRGMPPPIVFLTGLGEYQFNNHPCAITMVNENLPNDVDYIPCGKPTGIVPTTPPTGAPSTSTARKAGAGLGADGMPLPTGQNVNATNNTDTTYSKATYVPTKIDISFTMIPIQTRDQVSKEFSLADYASGKLLKKGFW